jgi:hypothetical protein
MRSSSYYEFVQTCLWDTRLSWWFWYFAVQLVSSQCKVTCVQMYRVSHHTATLITSMQLYSVNRCMSLLVKNRLWFLCDELCSDTVLNNASSVFRITSEQKYLMVTVFVNIPQNLNSSLPTNPHMLKLYKKQHDTTSTAKKNRHQPK